MIRPKTPFALRACSAMKMGLRMMAHALPVRDPDASEVSRNEACDGDREADRIFVEPGYGTIRNHETVSDCERRDDMRQERRISQQRRKNKGARAKVWSTTDK
jgi:hypothetical protein